ncbi:hypothetical protein PCE1_000801 [Barthelona sp. PCE]
MSELYMQCFMYNEVYTYMNDALKEILAEAVMFKNLDTDVGRIKKHVYPTTKELSAVISCIENRDFITLLPRNGEPQIFNFPSGPLVGPSPAKPVNAKDNPIRPN